MDAGNTHMGYCQPIELIGMGALEQYAATGSTNGARADYAVCISAEGSCSSDSQCKAETSVGCESASHVCLPPSLTACSAQGVPGAATMGTVCNPGTANGVSGQCVYTVDGNTDGVADSVSVCLPSCTTPGGGDGAMCLTTDASCVDVSGGSGVFVCVGGQ
jgi:hypothetical protein